MVVLPAAAHLVFRRAPSSDERKRQRNTSIARAIQAALIVMVAMLLADNWQPLGAGRGVWVNRLFVAALVVALLALLSLFLWAYRPMLKWVLANKSVVFCLAASIVFVSIRGSLLFRSPYEGPSVLTSSVDGQQD